MNTSSEQRPETMPTLYRVQMWLGRNWRTAVEARLEALAASDSQKYEQACIDERDWFRAFVLVNKLCVETYSQARLNDHAENT